MVVAISQDSVICAWKVIYTIVLFILVVWVIYLLNPKIAAESVRKVVSLLRKCVDDSVLSPSSILYGDSFFLHCKCPKRYCSF